MIGQASLFTLGKEKIKLNKILQLKLCQKNKVMKSLVWSKDISVLKSKILASKNREMSHTFFVIIPLYCRNIIYYT